MSCDMRKVACSICNNKGEDQLGGNRAVDQCVCFLLIRNFKPLVIFCGCTAQFVLDQVGNPEDRFSHEAAQKCLFTTPVLSFIRGMQSNQFLSLT